MSEDQLKAFLEVAKGDADLMDKIKAANGLDEIIAIASELGHSISVDGASLASAEITSEELELMRGGLSTGTDTESSKQSCNVPEPNTCQVAPGCATIVSN